MSRQKELLREIAAATNSGASDRISDWYTEDFRLHEPGSRLCRWDIRGPAKCGRRAAKCERD